MAAYIRFHDPWKLIESVSNYFLAHPECTIVADVDQMRQMYNFYVEPEPGEPYEVKTGWTIGAMSIIECRSNLGSLFKSSGGRALLLHKIRTEGFGRKRSRYEIVASDVEPV